MRIDSLNETNSGLWNRFVLEQDQGTLYHLAEWDSILCTTFNFKPLSIMAIDQQQTISGILPLFKMRDILFRRFLISSPFCNYSGLLCENQAAESALFNHAETLSSGHNAEYMELRQLTEPAGRSCRLKKSFVLLQLDLSPGKQALWENLTSRNRGKIRKAEKQDIKIRTGLNYLDDFYALFTKNMHRLGTPAYPKSFFINVCRKLKHFCDIIVLEKQGRIVAGMFLFKFKHIVSEPWVASEPNLNKIYINNLLYWKAICHACDHGFKLFDFGRSTYGSGTYQFKLQWRAEPRQLNYAYVLNKAAHIPVVDANQNKYDRIIRLWKMLPAEIVNMLGPFIVRYLPEL